MGKIPVDDRKEMIRIIEQQAPMGLTMFSSAITPLMIAIQKESDDNASAREDILGLVIDAAFCLIPTGKILGKFVAVLGKVASSRISQATMKLIIEKAQSGIPVELTKSVVSNVTKMIGKSVLDALATDVKKDFDLLGTMEIIFKKQIDNLLALVARKEEDYTAMPDELLSRLYARWDPNVNEPDLYKVLVTETFTEIKRITSSLGYKGGYGPTASTTTGQVLFNILEYSSSWPNGRANDPNSCWVNGIPILVVRQTLIVVKTDSGGRRTLEKVTETSVSRISSALRHFAFSLAWKNGWVLNDPFSEDQLSWKEHLSTYVNQLAHFDDDSTLYLKVHRNGKYAARKMFGLPLPSDRMFDIEPSIIAQVSF